MPSLLNGCFLARWVNEVKVITLDYIEARGCLGYSRGVQRQRPGIVKAAPVPAELSEDERCSTIVRSILDELDALISKQTAQQRVAFVWGTAERGGARLIDPLYEQDAESLRISWNSNEINGIEIESSSDHRFCGPESPIEPTALLDRLIPMVWAYIRNGGELPPGINRFADFF
jgi:hypothetical protein